MELVGVQRAGQLGDALFVELVQTVVQLDCAIRQLAHTVVQGGHAVIQALRAGSQLGAAVLGRVRAIGSGSDAVGVLVDAGHKILDLAQAGLEGADAGDIVAVLSLKLQLILHRLLCIGVGQQIDQTADHGRIVLLHQAQSRFEVMVGLGR